MSQIYTLPTKEEMASLRQEIRHMEVALDALRESIINAQKLADDMQKDIYRKQARIAPIRRVPMDVLSLVFIACSQGQWNAPQVIGAVCRLWRNVLFSTPRAWAYVRLDGLGVTQRQRWMKRSGVVGVHALTNGWISSPVVGADRIRCDLLTTLSVSSDEQSWLGLLDGYFPQLKTLKLASQGAYTGPQPLDRALYRNLLDRDFFPSLKELHLIELSLSGAFLFKGKELPSLEELVFARPKGNAWIQIMEDAAPSLASVGLWLGPQNSLKGDDKPPVICLPRLTHLTFIIEGSPFIGTSDFRFPVDISTPRLRSYHEWTSMLVTSPVHQDVASVSEAFIDSNSSQIDLSQFGSLERLTISLYCEHSCSDALRRLDHWEVRHLQYISVVDELGIASMDTLRKTQEHHKLAGRCWELLQVKSFIIKYREHEEWVQGEVGHSFLQKSARDL